MDGTFYKSHLDTPNRAMYYVLIERMFALEVIMDTYKIIMDTLDELSDDEKVAIILSLQAVSAYLTYQA